MTGAVPGGPGFVLQLACRDRPGIVHAVAGFLHERGGNILDSAQFGDKDTGDFFMRVHFQPGGEADVGRLRTELAPLARALELRWQLHDTAVRPRVMILVSRFGHCLNDLLFRARSGLLPIEIPAVVSNHEDFRQLSANYDVPFHHLPLQGRAPCAKARQEARLVEVMEQHRVDLVVLARYMQILSPALCGRLAGRAINIHHSFLPSFKGAKPYGQAFDRGVKLIGATAHYVTMDLDEGPIIEQEVERVDHSMDPERLAATGRDVECVALARAVRWHIEHRVALNGHKTVVFR